MSVIPHITPFAFDGQANSGDSVQLNCYISKGDSPLSISWTFNDNSIESTQGIFTAEIGGRTSLLTIGSVTADHRGNYTCTASNAVGSAHHTAMLLVNGN